MMHVKHLAQCLAPGRRSVMARADCGNAPSSSLQAGAGVGWGWPSPGAHVDGWEPTGRMYMGGKGLLSQGPHPQLLPPS